MLAGCLPTAAFTCAEDSECDAAVGARCVQGGCATPDPECDGGYRYAEDAGQDRRGVCIPLDGTSSSGATSLGPEGSTASTSLGTGGVSSSSGVPGESTTGTSSSSSDSSSGAGTSESGTTGCGDVCTCDPLLAVGYQHNCAVREDATVACWGRNHYGQAGTAEGPMFIAQLRVVDLGGAPVASVEAAYFHSCAAMQDGTAWCWGRNLEGQVDPSAAPQESQDPVPVDGIDPAIALEVGLRNSCARHAGDRISCWGDNQHFQLLSSEEGPGPYGSGPHAGLEELGLGFYHGCMRTGSDVSCWGRNNWGQLAEPIGPSSAEPRAVPLAGPAEALAVAREHSCALVDGSVYCWGRNAFNQISGEGTATYAIPTEIQPVWEGQVVRLFAQGYTTCVETDDPALWCWGGTAGGYLGVQGAANSVPLWPPQRIAAYDELEQPIVEIGGGIQHMCAVLSSEAVSCWGNSNLGQIGPVLPDNDEYTVLVDVCESR